MCKSIPFLIGCVFSFYSFAQNDTLPQHQEDSLKVTALEYARYNLEVKRSFVLDTSRMNQSDYKNSVYRILDDSLRSPIGIKGVMMDSSEEFFFSPSFEYKAIIKDPGENNLTRNKKNFVGPSQFDSRIEVLNLDITDSLELFIYDNTKSVGILVERERIEEIADGLYELDISHSLGETFNLCEYEAFVSQPSVGIGTAFMVAQDTFLTANHVFERPISDYVLVYGYHLISRSGIVEAYILEENVYYLNEVLNQISDLELDLAFFTVDRPTNRKPLSMGGSENLNNGTKVYCIGYPSGLPAKVSVNASILENDNWGYFYTSLDAFQGNSGSPVFNLDTHEVIGILVSGELDYIKRGGCNRVTLCKYPNCKGEKVIRVEKIYELLR